jgi:pimeloyl-ACP methyl ester carboxylesterase
MALPIRNSRIRLSQGRLFWREVGTGTTVVLLHSAWEDSEEWLSVLEQLGGMHHCLVPDCLGFGESDRPKIHYSIDQQVESLTEFLDTLGTRSVYLVGHSLGGWIAASYALRYPDRVRGLVLIHPEGVEVHSGRSRWQTERWLTSPIPLRVWGLQLLRPLLKLMGCQEQVTQWLRQRRQLLRSPVACQLLFRRRTAEIQGELLGDRLFELKMPLLLLQSQICDGNQMAIAAAYAQAPFATVHELPGSATEVLHIHGLEIARQIEKFIQSQE